jgi:hypothetical protein
LLDHREKDGQDLLPDEWDEKTGDKVLEVLKLKHPDTRVPDASKCKAYKTCPDFMDLDITE